MATGLFTNLSGIPEEFVEMLFDGPKAKSELGAAVKSLTVGGLVMPERKNHEGFIWCRRDSRDQRYGIANSIMVEYYLQHGFRE